MLMAKICVRDITNMPRSVTNSSIWKASLKGVKFKQFLASHQVYTQGQKEMYHESGGFVIVSSHLFSDKGLMSERNDIEKARRIGLNLKPSKIHAGTDAVFFYDADTAGH